MSEQASRIEVNEQRLDKIFGTWEELTEEPLEAMKAELRARRAKAKRICSSEVSISSETQASDSTQELSRPEILPEGQKPDDINEEWPEDEVVVYRRNPNNIYDELIPVPVYFLPRMQTGVPGDD